MNWGTKIIIGMLVFILFIVAMGTKMILSNGNDDLVENDYYEKGLSYSEEYNKKLNAARDGVVPTVQVYNKDLSVTFKGPSKYLIECKYVSNSAADKNFKGATKDKLKVVIPKEHFRPGAWRINIEFTSNSKDYQFKQEIYIP